MYFFLVDNFAIQNSNDDNKIFLLFLVYFSRLAEAEFPRPVVFLQFPTILPHLHFVRGGAQLCPTSFVQFYMLFRYIKMDKTYWMPSRGYTEFRLRVETDVIRPSSKIRIQIRPFKNTVTESTLKKSTGS